jgi:uncharacterized protein involved in exopolysaccharide biosynthesis
MEEKQVYEDEVTLRDLILKLREYVLETLRFWYIPLIFACLGAAYQFYKYSSVSPVYPARITFSVDEDEGGGTTGLSSVLGQFGLGGVRPTRYNLDKILELSKSRRVVQQTLFTKITIDGNNDYIANHILRIYELYSLDKKSDKDVASFSFTHDSLPAFNRRENEALLMIYNFIIGPPNKPKESLLAADYNKDTNIMSLSATTKDETLSLELSRTMFESLSSYYVNKAIEKQLKTFTIVSAKRDSLLGVLKSLEYQLANFKDTHRSVPMRTDMISELRLQRELAAVTAMYAEVLKNTEIADFALRNKTPFIQVIDSPIPPIAPEKASLLRKILIGLIIGGAIGVALIAIRKIYLSIMSKSN